LENVSYNIKIALDSFHEGNIKHVFSGDEILLAVVVETEGWVGFGIAEESSGSMPGADVFTAYVDNQGNVVLQDRHALAKETPIIDDCQDWFVEGGEEVDGVTTIELRRKLVTEDPSDRPIIRGTPEQNAKGVPLFTRVVYAFGVSDTIEYHESNRRATAINFFPEDTGKCI
jgi:hypothetical protein